MEKILHPKKEEQKTEEESKEEETKKEETLKNSEGIFGELGNQRIPVSQKFKGFFRQGAWYNNRNIGS